MKPIGPKLHILIPVFNGEKTIGETIDSLLAQTFKDFILTVVDNGSTDETIAKVKKYNDTRIEIVESINGNIGPYENLNKCIKLSRGEYVAIFHADDVYHKKMLEIQVKELEAHSEVGAVFTQAQLIDQYSKTIGLRSSIKKLRDFSKNHVQSFDEVFRALLKYNNFLMTPSAMVRGDIYRNLVKNWEIDKFATAADLGVWLKILENFNIVILPDVLMSYRISKTQGSYAINFNRTEQSDFFKVTEFYLKKPKVREFLEDVDYKNYIALKTTDNVIRAFGYFKEKKYFEALNLCKSISSIRTLVDAFQSRRGFKTFVLGWGLYFSTLLLCIVKGGSNENSNKNKN